MIDELRAKVMPVIDDAHKAIIMLTEVAKELQDPEKGVQQLLANLNSIADKIDRGEGSIGRLVTEDKLVIDLEELMARMGPLFDDLKKIIDNVSGFSTEFDVNTGDIPKIIHSLKKTMASMEKVMEDMSKATPHLPQIVENLDNTSDAVPIMVLQVQQVMVELERLIRQLQSHWLFGGRSGQQPQETGRISPLEASP